MKNKTIIYLLGIVLLATACYKNNLEDLASPDGCDVTDITYSKDVRPIVNIFCGIGGCHNAATVETFPLVTYEQLKAEVDNGLLLKSINHSPGAVAMPKNTSKLADCYIRKITAWVNAGALNN